jgi:hypothetical protein
VLHVRTSPEIQGLIHESEHGWLQESIPLKQNHRDGFVVERGVAESRRVIEPPPELFIVYDRNKNGEIEPGVGHLARVFLLAQPNCV